MRCLSFWIQTLIYSISINATKLYEPFSFNRFELEHYKNQTKQLFYFAFDNYLDHAFPFDELKPISCTPKTRNFTHADDTATNDVLGNFSATLVDSLTTIAILGDTDRFEHSVSLIEDVIPIDFDIDSTVQVFETTIRIIGGLLSAHLYATDPRKKVYLGDRYSGHLLSRARNLADRLLPVYLTSSGLPLPRINLRYGFRGFTADMIDENNAAAMACPMFEFTILSYLTHDDKYRQVTRYAFDKTWSLRSNLNLLPMSFNPETKSRYCSITGTGASIDSFYEYALKGAILFNDNELLKVWHKSYRSLNVHAKADWFYVNVNTDWGQVALPWIDSLSAFFPGLQVLNGDLEEATIKHTMFLKLWNAYGGIPERWNFQVTERTQKGEIIIKEKDIQVEDVIALEWYPLRPEFVESTYFLYRATKDPFYLNIGWNILHDLNTRFKSNCGFAGIQNVITGVAQDRMETFVLSETLKYLYLLFDEGNELHSDRGNVVFSTEAHPVWLTRELIDSYEKNRYFKDSAYSNHLKMVKENEVLKKNEPSFGDLIMGLAKSLFTSTEPANEAIETKEPHKSIYETVEVCPYSSKAKVTHNSLYSEMLSSYPALFEVDHRYSHLLAQPPYLKERRPIELTAGFYKRWYDPSGSQCALKATTESFEMAFDSLLELTDRSRTVSKGNGTTYIKYDSLTGCKIRIEKLTPGSVDTHGEMVDTNLFTDTPLKNLDTGGSAQSENQSPAALYRITFVNGDRVPTNAVIVLDKQELFGDNSKEQESFRNFLGYNAKQQLLLDSIPVVNTVLV